MTFGYSGSAYTATQDPFPYWEGNLGIIYTKVSVGSTAPTLTPTTVAVSTGVNPVETSYSLYGHIVPLSVFGKGRIGGEIIAGPWLENGLASFIISFGVPADPAGTRILHEIAFDSEVVWTGTLTGAGTPSSAGFSTEPITCRFYDGKLTQPADSLEIAHFGADAVAYRPEMLLVFENVPLTNTKFGKIPYVAAVISDTSGEDVNLGEAFERLAYSPWVGYSSAQFETSGVTDGLVSGGLIIAEDITFLDLIQSFGRFYPTWDILQTDKLRIVDRGATVAPDFTLDGSRLTGEVTVRRQGQDMERKLLELSTIDPDADYTIMPSVAELPTEPVQVTTSVGKDSAYLPAIMDSSTRMSIVTLAKYHEELTRKGVSATAMAHALEMEPGDLVRMHNLGADFSNETFKVVETLHGANCTVEFTAAPLLKCSLEPTDAQGGFIAASDTRYDVSTTMDQDIPSCASGDILIAAVMHRSTLTTLSGWTLVDSVSAGFSGGTHSLSLFTRIAGPSDSGATITWTQSSAVRISVHIQVFRSAVRTLSVVSSASNHTNNTSAVSIDTAEAAATGDGQIGVAYATSALADGLLPTGLALTMDNGAHQTTLPANAFLDDNRLCGGYALIDLGQTTAGDVTADFIPTAGGGWAALSLVLG
jgi:hypothetical protein